MEIFELVAATCRTANVAYIRSLGADRVIDYQTDGGKLIYAARTRNGFTPASRDAFPLPPAVPAPKNTGDSAQARRKAPEVPEPAISLCDDACTVRGLNTMNCSREGKSGLSARGSEMEWDFYLALAATISAS
jgi:hypothetical protein